MNDSESMLTYRKEERGSTLVAGNCSWTIEKRKQPFRLGRYKTDRRSGVLCHTDVTAYVRESGGQGKAEPTVQTRQANGQNIQEIARKVEETTLTSKKHHPQAKKRPLSD
ncbi:hypothetical protein [Bacillus sp. FJAT-52991]|uniref:Transposase n=1 Tax=Bacillus kandeliae TaxID=3129297 RepID=A0ABZ2N4C0_9BACI